MENFKPSKDQQEVADAFCMFLQNPDSKEIVIEGGPGVGKSALVNHLIKLAGSMSDLRRLVDPMSGRLNLSLTSTTNKAAKVLSDFTKANVCTIHSLLKLRVFDNYNTGTQDLRTTPQSVPLYNQIIVIDEGGLVDTELLKLIRQLTRDCKLVVIGDDCQVADVGHLSCPMFNNPYVSQFSLTTQHRQGDGSTITDLVWKYRAAVKGGPFPKIVPDGKYIFQIKAADFQREINECYTHPNAKPNDYKVLAWTNARVLQYNKYIRGLMTDNVGFNIGEYVVTNNPLKTPGNNETFAPTECELIVQDITEGELHGFAGWWIDVVRNDDTSSSIQVFQPAELFRVKHKLKEYHNAGDYDRYFAMKAVMVDLRPMHASTVHKSQGSTYKTAFVDLKDIGGCANPSLYLKQAKHSLGGSATDLDVHTLATSLGREMLARIMVTATSRPSQKVVFFGQLPEEFRGE